MTKRLTVVAVEQVDGGTALRVTLGQPRRTLGEYPVSVELIVPMADARLYQIGSRVTVTITPGEV